MADPPTLIDTHCHLDFDWFDEDREEVVRRAAEAGVARIIAPGIDPASSEKAVRLADQFDGVYAAVGVHPNTNLVVGEEESDRLRDLAKHPKVIAIGEIGLDYYRDHTPREQQQANLETQIRLASDLGLPIILHNREASSDLLNMLVAWRESSDDGLANRPGVLHTFSAGWEEAQVALAHGFYLGFSGPLTYDKADVTRHVAAQAPIERLLVETDAPFLTPQPLRGRVKRNEPAFVKHVAERMAGVRDLSFEALAAATTANAERLFALPVTG